MADTGHIKSLDGLRALGVLLVMTFHAEITHFGWFGVQLFFVLSGFLITGILWKEKSRPDNNTAKFKKFWVRRSLRIFPLYFGYLFVLGLSWVLFHFPSYYPTYIPWLITYVYNFTRTFPHWVGNPLFTHLWSLSIEEQFYLLFPFVILLCRPGIIRWFMLTIIVLAPLVRFFLAQYYQSRGLDSALLADTLYWNTLSHIDAFFIGGIIPVLSLDKRIRRPILILRFCLAIALLAGVWNFISSYASTGNGFFTDLGYNHGQTGHYEYVWQYTVLNLAFASFILVLVSSHARTSFTRLRRFLESKWLMAIGQVSYGMYIFHWLILVYIVSNLLHPVTMLQKILIFIPYTAAVYFFALLSYRIYELPFIRLKDRFFPSTSTKTPGTKEDSGANEPTPNSETSAPAAQIPL
jgi:peptidoglycan/LPS O-acetylase OafA/YrhL